MDVLLFSSSGHGETRLAESNRSRALALARACAARSDRVGWLCAVAPGDIAPTLDLPNVEQVAVEVAPAPFRRPLAALAHLALETAWTRLLRAGPKVAWIGGYAAGTSIQLPWLAERLGVPAILEVDLATTLCHRSTLIDESGRECTRYDDPQRCIVCCLHPSPAGLTAWQSTLAKRLRRLGDVSPFVSDDAMLNRLDSIVGGLNFAKEVHVVDEAARMALSQVGVAPGKLRVRDTTAPIDATLAALDRVAARSTGAARD